MTQKSEARLARDAAENAPTRTAEEVQAEYRDTCTGAGDLQYKIEVFKQQLSAINSKLWALNQEAANIRDKAAAASVAPAASEAAPTPLTVVEAPIEAAQPV